MTKPKPEGRGRGWKRKDVPWQLVMRQLYAGHPIQEIARWTVGVAPRTLRLKAVTELEPHQLEEYSRLVMRNRMPAAGHRARCGTGGGATKHRRAGEPLCFQCKVGEANRHREGEGRRKAQRS